MTKDSFVLAGSNGPGSATSALPQAEARSVPQTVHIVMATKGEYSDRSEWPLVAYLDESLAREHAEKAEAWMQANPCPFDAWETEADEWHAANPSPYGVQNDGWDRARLFVYSVPVATALPDVSGVVGMPPGEERGSPSDGVAAASTQKEAGQ